MRTGGCQCGNLRYEITAEPLDVYACHCRECQKQSASAFGISVIFPRAEVRIIKGEPRIWTRPTDSGNTTDCYFCPDCGTRIMHAGTWDRNYTAIKGGSLDEPPDMTRAKHIWTDRTLAGIAIPPGCETWPGEPDD
ncbi:MAG: GFA family protein [Rhodospirillales bacterium]